MAFSRLQTPRFSPVLFALLLVMVGIPFTMAQPSSNAQDPKPVQQLIITKLGERLAKHGMPTVTVLADGVQRFAACESLQAQLPTASTLRSRISVRVECKAPRHWVTYVTATVALPGNYVVTHRAVSAGETLDGDSISLQQGDLIGLPPDTLTKLDEAIGQVASRRLRPGQPLRARHLRHAGAIVRGHAVRIKVVGNGFTAATEGHALATASPGKLVKVRTASGQVITGIARDAATVEIPM